MDSIVLSTIQDLERKASNYIEPEPATKVMYGDLFMIGNQLSTFCLICGEEIDHNIKHKEDID